jgi:hypothetical protein
MVFLLVIGFNNPKSDGNNSNVWSIWRSNLLNKTAILEAETIIIKKGEILHSE